MTPEIKQRIEQIRNGEVPEGYTNTPAGILPKEWSCAKLSDISEVITETAGERAIETVSISAGIGFVNQAQKFGKELSGNQYSKYIVLHKGDFAYNKGNSNRYPQGCTYMLKERETAAVPNVFECFRIHDDVPKYYEQLFLFGFMNKQLARLINHGVRDDGLLNLTDKDFYSVILPVPPTEEQRKIAEILATCDRVIELKQKLVDELKKLKKVCLEKMFPQKGNSVPEIRFPGFTAPWEQCELGEISSIKTGPFGTQLSAKEYVPYGRPVINVKNIGTGYVIEKDLDCISEQTALRLKDHILFENDVVFGRKGAIDRHAFIKREQNGWLQGSDCIRVRVSPGFLGSYFNAYLQTTIANTYLSTKAHGSTMSTLTTNMISSLPVWLPELAEQKHIAKTISCIDDCITFHQRELEAEQQKKKALMQLLLTGIVRV